MIRAGSNGELCASNSVDYTNARSTVDSIWTDVTEYQSMPQNSCASQDLEMMNEVIFIGALYCNID